MTSGWRLRLARETSSRVRRHDRLEPALNQRSEWHEIGRGDFGERARIDRDLGVRVCGDESVPRKVLADCRHPGRTQAAMQRRCQVRDGVRVVVKRAISDDRARAVINVEHGCETEIDPVRDELGCQRAPEAGRLAGRARNVAIPQLAQCAHRRDGREAVPKALHAATFVIDCNEWRRRAQRANCRRQRS